MSLFYVESDICDLSTDVDALRKQIWLVMKNIQERDYPIASMNYGQFCQAVKNLEVRITKIQRKIEDYESSASS